MGLINLIVGGFLFDTLILLPLVVIGGALLARVPLAKALQRAAAIVFAWLACLLGLAAMAEGLAAFDALAAELFVRNIEGGAAGEVDPIFAGADTYEHAQVVTLLLVLVVNVAWARSSRARYVFVNPLHLLLASAVLLALFAQAGVSAWVATPVVAAILGSAGAWLPYLAAKRLGLRGDGFGVGSFGVAALGAGRWAAARWGETRGGGPPEELLGSDLRRSPIYLAAFIVGGLAILLSLNAGMEVSETILQGVTLLHVLPSSGSGFFIVGAALLGFEVALGLWLSLTFLPMVSGALVTSFEGWRRWLPGVEPALDALFLLPQAPQVVPIGFALCLGGGLLGYYLFGAVGLSPVVPGVLAAMTGGGAAAVVAYRAGGRRGALIAAPCYAVMVSFLGALALTASSALGDAATVELSDLAAVEALLATVLLPFG